MLKVGITIGHSTNYEGPGRLLLSMNPDRALCANGFFFFFFFFFLLRGGGVSVSKCIL